MNSIGPQMAVLQLFHHFVHMAFTGRSVMDEYMTEKATTREMKKNPLRWGLSPGVAMHPTKGAGFIPPTRGWSWCRPNSEWCQAPAALDKVDGSCGCSRFLRIWPLVSWGCSFPCKVWTYSNKAGWRLELLWRNILSVQRVMDCS